MVVSDIKPFLVRREQEKHSQLPQQAQTSRPALVVAHNKTLAAQHCNELQ